MPQYRLTYFDARGFAETARMLFALAGVEYEDKRMTSEEWPAIRPNTPFNQVPMLEVDGVQIAQTTAIYRFLARTFGFAGSSLLEEARGDMIMECVRDMTQALFKIRSAPDDQKPELLKELSEKTLPPQLEKMNAFIGDQQFFLGDKISWVDIAYFNFMPYFKKFGIDLPYEKYPALLAVSKNVADEPKIAEWIAKRPVTEN